MKRGCDLMCGQMSRTSIGRLNDKLVENILSYLTFNEKVLFESVSKQFQRCVINQQKALHLEKWETEDNDSLNGILEPIEVVDFNSATALTFRLKQINKFWLKSITKKFNSIEKVSLNCYVVLEDLDIICKNCPKLKSIKFETIGLSAYDLDHFGRQYGNKFERINLFYSSISHQYCNKFLFHCKNLKELLSINIHEIALEDIPNLPDIQIIRSYPIKELDRDHNLRRFEDISHKLSETLIELSLIICGDSDTNELDHVFNSIYKLKKLKTLNFGCPNSNECKGVDTYITKLSQNIPGLKSFFFCSDYWLKDFHAFERFTNLVDLSIILRYKENITIKGSVECLKSAQNLKSLDINIEIIGEEFFKNIDKHLPNLSILRISCESEITDKTVFQLSNLKKLKQFWLNRYKKCNKFITDESVCAVINGCPALYVLSFGSRPNITGKTIEALISCANTYPKRKLDFWCGICDNHEEEDVLPSILMSDYYAKIPQNLSIIYNVEL